MKHGYPLAFRPDIIGRSFKYTFEHIRHGRVIDVDEVLNLVPTEGLTYESNLFAGGAQVATWYVFPFEGNYTPVLGATAANISAAATECTAYVASTRVAWVPVVSGGSITNAASKASFVFNATKTIYGCGLISISTKGATTGTLLSVVRASTAKDVESGDTLNVTVARVLVNV